MSGSKRYAEGARLRFLNRRIIILMLFISVIAVLAAAGALIAYLKSSTFEARVRAVVIAEIQNRTGAEVSLGNFS